MLFNIKETLSHSAVVVVCLFLGESKFSQLLLT